MVDTQQQTNGNGAAPEHDDVPEWLNTMLRSISRYIEAQCVPLRARIAELEARPFLHEAGTWEQNKSYGIGAVVTDRGSAWVCRLRPTSERPGESGDWRLLVKRGKDGKDAPRDDHR